MLQQNGEIVAVFFCAGKEYAKKDKKTKLMESLCLMKQLYLQ